MTINFNVPPYNDDFDETKNFSKILFQPEVPVQARELTQIQSILQNQIRYQGNHLFKNGTVVSPGYSYLDNTVKCVTFNAATYDVSDKIKYKLVGATSLASATIIASNGLGKAIVKFTTGNTFSLSSENILVVNSATDTALSGTSLQVTSITPATVVSIDDGVYYVNGYFVKVNAHSYVISDTSSTPTVSVGLEVTESIVTATVDETLYDNSQGFYNQRSPGADRYKLALTLGTRAFDYAGISTDTNISFVQLMKVDSGVVLKNYDQTEYSEIEKALARRTYDESGDYVVKPFSVSMGPYFNNNRGTYASSGVTYYVNDIVSKTTGGVLAYYKKFDSNSGSPATNANSIYIYANGWRSIASPKYNAGISTDGAYLTKHVAKIGSGKAYIKGFEIAPSPQNVMVDPADTSETKTKNSYPSVIGTILETDGITGDTTALATANVVMNMKDLAGSTVGTCSLRGLETRSADSSYAFVTNVVLNAGVDINTVKSLTNGTFTITLKVHSLPLSGVISGTSGSTAVSGYGTQFLVDLKPGYIISVVGTSTTYKVATIESNTLMHLSTTLGSTLSSASAAVLLPIVTYGAPAVIKLDDYVKSLNEAQTSYYENHMAYVASASSGNTLNVSSALGSYTYDQSSFMLINHTSGAYVDMATVTFNTGTKVFSGAGIVNNESFTFLFRSVNSSVSATKSKTLATKDIVINSTTMNDYGGAASSPDANWNFANTRIQLPITDAIRLVKVYMSGGAIGAAYSETGKVDVTDRYVLESGQTDDYYGPSVLVLKANESAPQKPIRAIIEYFQHGSGDYFSIESYGSMSYRDIPQYKGLSLRDCIDFRPSVNISGATFMAVTIPATNVISFNKPLLVTYDKYLPRKDVITLSSNGTFKVVKGVPAVDPKLPMTPDNTLDIAEVLVKPYASGQDDDQCEVVMKEHRGYTMAEIGKLEKRIENVEYYVALTTLQKNTAELKFYDSNGVERFKNGFAADDFKSFLLSNIKSPEYRVSLDLINGVCHPRSASTSVSLSESSGVTVTNSVRNPGTSSAYQVTGNVASLPYTNKSYIVQDAATKGVNVNPFSVVTFNGILFVTPMVDTWIDTITKLNVTEVRGSSTVENNYFGSYSWNATQKSLGSTTTSTSTTISSTEVVKDSVAPVMRKRSVVLAMEQMSPNTTFYAFMDGENISQYISGVTTLEININSTGKTFNTYNIGGIKSNDIAYRINDSIGIYDVFNQGDTVVFTKAAATVATAVVADYGLQSTTNNGKSTYIKLVNVKYASGKTLGDLVGSALVATPSGVTASVTSATLENTIKTNSLGKYVGVFTIPAGRFTSGTKSIKFIDNASNDDLSSISKTGSSYTATGTIKNVTVNQTNRIDTKTINSWEWEASPWTWNGGYDSGGWGGGGSGDPLAQSFTVTQPEGIMVTGVDIFFKKKPSAVSETITCQICEMLNGYPTKNIVGFASVQMSPDQITTSATGTTATRFTFPRIERLAPNTEYCIKLLTNSTGYEVWVAEMGKTRVDMPVVVTEQPSLGTLFKSQNNSTWNAEQLEDLKFTLYRAQFDTTKSSLVSLVNRPDGGAASTSSFLRVNLPGNPIKLTNGSTYAVINHPNHGLRATNQVRLYWPDATSFATIPGILTSQDGSALTVTTAVTYVVDDDNYVVTLNGTYTTTADVDVGGNGVQAEVSARYENVMVGLNYLIFDGSTVSTTLGSVSSGTGINVTENLDVNTVVALNSSRWLVPSSVANTSSVQVNFTMASSTDYMSPLVDMSSASALLLTNRLNTPTTATHNYSTARALFVDENETAANKINGGSALSKYVTNPITLDTVSQSLRVLFDASIPETSDIKLYYRTAVNDSSKLEASAWVAYDISKVISKSTDGKFKEYEIVMDDIPVAFTTFQIKLALLGTNPATPPLVKNVRTIALL